MSNDSEPKKDYLICEAWNGSRTPGFLKFKRDFMTGMSAIYLHEDDYSLWQACNDSDQGGQAAGADALPAQGQAGHLNAVRRRRRRQAKAFERIYKHIDDERLKEMLSALQVTHQPNDRQAAVSWQLILTECDQGTNDLQIVDIRAEFENCTIELNIGYQEETITAYSRLLNSINTRLPANHRYNDDQLTVKFLCNINHPESLALEAVTELNATAGSRRFEHTVNNAQVRDYRRAVTHFDAMWRGLFKQGIIRMRAAGRKHDSGALRVHDDHDDDDEDNNDDDDSDAARFVSRGGRGGRGGRGIRGRGFPARGRSFTPRPLLQQSQSPPQWQPCTAQGEPSKHVARLPNQHQMHPVEPAARRFQPASRSPSCC